MAHTHTLATLKEEKARVAAEIARSGKRLEDLVSGIPGRLLGSTLGMVASAVVTGLQNHHQKKEEQQAEAAMAAEAEREPESFGKTLQSVGEETAYFALAKLVEKLVARQ